MFIGVYIYISTFKPSAISSHQSHLNTQPEQIKAILLGILTYFLWLLKYSYSDVIIYRFSILQPVK